MEELGRSLICQGRTEANAMAALSPVPALRGVPDKFGPCFFFPSRLKALPSDWGRRCCTLAESAGCAAPLRSYPSLDLVCPSAPHVPAAACSRVIVHTVGSMADLQPPQPGVARKTLQAVCAGCKFIALELAQEECEVAFKPCRVTVGCRECGVFLCTRYGCTALWDHATSSMPCSPPSPYESWEAYVVAFMTAV